MSLNVYSRLGAAVAKVRKAWHVLSGASSREKKRELARQRARARRCITITLPHEAPGEDSDAAPATRYSVDSPEGQAIIRRFQELRKFEKERRSPSAPPSP
jgi:hypothetical protein